MRGRGCVWRKGEANLVFMQKKRSEKLLREEGSVQVALSLFQASSPGVNPTNRRPNATLDDRMPCLRGGRLDCNASVIPWNGPCNWPKCQLSRIMPRERLTPEQSITNLVLYLREKPWSHVKFPVALRIALLGVAQRQTMSVHPSSYCGNLAIP